MGCTEVNHLFPEPLIQLVKSPGQPDSPWIIKQRRQMQRFGNEAEEYCTDCIGRSFRQLLPQFSDGVDEYEGVLSFRQRTPCLPGVLPEEPDEDFNRTRPESFVPQPHRSLGRQLLEYP